MQRTNVLTGKLTFTSLTPLDLATCTKSEICAYFENSYNLNESIFTAIKDDASFYKYPDKLRLPLLFYYAHPACVYINKLMISGLIQERVNLEYEAMFETGVDEMTWDDTEASRLGEKFAWPPVAEVTEYRRKVRNLILKVINDTPLHLPVTLDSPWWALMMGMEHERIHLETSSVLIRQLPVDLVQKPEGWKYAPSESGIPCGDNKLIETDETVVKIGKPYNFPSYGWDNEYGKLEMRVPRFKATKYPITNQEFREFVREGGYFEKSYWTDEGWKWVQHRQCSHPTFWVCDQGCKSGCGGDLSNFSHCKPSEVEHLTNGQNAYCNGHSSTDGNGHQGEGEGGGGLTKTHFRYRAMFDVINMPWDWPVEVNYHEAKAFSRWMGSEYRLPTEAEHHVMRGEQLHTSTGTVCDIIFQDKVKQNINMQYGSSSNVNAYGPSKAGFYDMFGNVWEWVEDHFNGLPGYKPAFYYEDFSTPTFDGRHNMILGGSWISTGDEASRFARYAFRRHFFQHCGFRLVKAAKMEETPVRLVNTEVFILGLGVEGNPDVDKNAQVIKVPSTNRHYYLETLQELQHMLQFEYSSEKTYPVQLMQLAMDICQQNDINTARALHIGCATGRGSFILAKMFNEVLAVDLCGRYLDAAMTIQQRRSVPFYEKSNSKKIQREASVINCDDNDKVTFKQLTWLPNEVGFFDFILFQSIDRVMVPQAWLCRFWELLCPGALVMIASGDGWDHNNLKPKGLSLVGQMTLSYDGMDKPADVTIWAKQDTIQ